MAKTATLYDELGVSARATDVEIRRAYRNLVTKTHPDRGGDPAAFKRIQQAYEILSDAKKRERYDATGKVEKSVEEEFSDSFAGGSFRDRTLEEDLNRANISEQITVRQGPEARSHTAGFEAWMRSRGDGATEVFTAETMAAKFGVVEGSYDAVPLPRLDAHVVSCKAAGKPGEALAMATEPLPAALGWGEVLVNVQAAPVNPADLYTALMGGRYGPDQRDPPFAAGHDGIGVVVKVGAGVKGLAEGDWVLPFRAFQGTWRDLAIWKKKDALKVPADCVPLEYAALLRELFTAYRLLEDHGSLKPGDCVILNAANSTVGQLVVQLCRLLQLRCVAVVRLHDDDGFDKVAAWLRGLGASEVIADQMSVKEELDKLKFFAKPKLALDAVGGASAVRLSDALSEGGSMVIYGCMCGKAPPLRWDSWVFREIQVKGFNLRRWMSKNRKRVPPMLDAIAKLVNGDRLRIAYTEYDLATEFEEALDHAQDSAKNTKVLLRSPAIDLTAV